MKIITKIADMQHVSKIEKKQGKSIGFVPTMGFLHEGHETLIQKAREANEIVILSIFVNPLQFGPNEDLESYPRDFARDEKIAQNLGVDYLFYPSVEEMYPGDRTTLIKVEQRVDVLCGKHRHGHFDGVATVVMKLFQIVNPDFAYFGMKDAQQVAVLEGLITDYHLQVKLERVETVREEDGLAKSSRNVYLTLSERKEAPTLYRALRHGKDRIIAGASIASVKDEVSGMIQRETTGIVEYVEIYTYPTLEQIEQPQEFDKLIIAVAVKFSKARLIDNIVFSYEKGE